MFQNSKIPKSKIIVYFVFVKIQFAYIAHMENNMRNQMGNPCIFLQQGSNNNENRSQTLMHIMLKAPRIIDANDCDLMQKIDDQWNALRFQNVLEDWIYEKKK